MKMVTIMTILWVATVMSAAQPLCDPLSQYELNGQCCQMCRPGTSMSHLGTCAVPHCLPCDEGEYQDTYTTEALCKLQPYCDPNKNFQVAKQMSKTEKNTCMCELGFHCSSDECLTCVRHKPCNHGWGVLFKGNQTHDTVCHKCPEGSFSNVTSWNSSCLAWTRCKSGYVIERKGSDQSDVVCEKNRREHVIITCVVLLLIGIVLITAIKIWLSRGKGDFKGKDCIETCVRHDKVMTKGELLIAMPTPDGIHEEAVLPGEQAPRENHHSSMRQPEENDDGPGQVAFGHFTDKGNYVAQENGKAEVLSRQESQSMTVTSEIHTDLKY
ncbi:tumor necrosis factor receptor superfamily member 5 [Corythoichthys intestinalis]|uniref:tumor necrosis factor receptor superfamily member 5 n=1 Tax=Corythoichthys intestinalis TaxID=161448 RepID=UPI0025A5A373|nr:tumor necrosis factor receptor superfamily member 5 [Corythoichthys intestinalis]XP_061802648.1 tumor necrosis factor receptor superfamily member 5-like [Nerophis lumbriciformis]